MNPRRCMACWKCVEKCPKKVIGKTGFLGHRHVIFENADACIGCNKCIKTCPQGVFFKPDASVSCTMNMGMAFRIERLLPLAFVASAVTGIGLHIAGHGTSHETWHNWGVAHVVASFIWLLSVMAHVRRHKHWYKQTPDNLFPVHSLFDCGSYGHLAGSLCGRTRLFHRIVALQTRHIVMGAFPDSCSLSEIVGNIRFMPNHWMVGNV